MPIPCWSVVVHPGAGAGGSVVGMASRYWIRGSCFLFAKHFCINFTPKSCLELLPFKNLDVIYSALRVQNLKTQKIVIVHEHSGKRRGNREGKSMCTPYVLQFKDC